jgi:hypothetical protein
MNISVATGASCSGCGPNPEHETEALSAEPVSVLSSLVTAGSFKRRQRTTDIYIYKMRAYASITENGSLCLLNHN